LPPFASVPLSPEAPLEAFPKTAGVLEFLGREGRSLLVGRPQNLRRFVAMHTGRGPAPKKGARPPLDLRAIAVLVRYRETRSAFEQRLVFERTLKVPRAKRRDLKDAYFVALDPEERFPRFAIRHGDPGEPALFGPFRGRAQADEAVAALTASFPLRPCDFVFEPRVDLPLGEACLFAQTRSCPAPCLVRISEGDYRDLARRAAAVLEDPRARGEATPLPPFVTRSLGSSGLVVIPGDEVSLYPVLGWSVLETGAARAPRSGVREAVRSLSFAPGPTPPDDSPWLTEWLYARKREGAYLPRLPADCLEDAVERMLDQEGGLGPRIDGNVGPRSAS
jgi:hypothetical protein